LLFACSMSQPKTRSPKTERRDKLAQMVAEYERSLLVEYLKKHRGQIGATAEDLGIGARGLQKKLAAHGLADFAAQLRTQHGIKGPRGSRD
jgi:DNA-binding NtrC family response regulator